MVPARDRYHNEYGVRRGAHCCTVELQAVQIYLPVAVADQARVHEVSRVVSAIDTTMVDSPRLDCQGGVRIRAPRQHPPDPKPPSHCPRDGTIVWTRVRGARRAEQQRSWNAWRLHADRHQNHTSIDWHDTLFILTAAGLSRAVHPRNVGLMSAFDPMGGGWDTNH